MDPALRLTDAVSLPQRHVMTHSPVLVVDADTTLWRTALPLEGFWRLASRSPLELVAAADGSGKRWRAAIESELVAMAADDPLPPMNEDVLAAMRECRAQGGRVVLVTARPQAFADRLAERLGCVDEAHGAGRAVAPPSAVLDAPSGDRAREKEPAPAAQAAPASARETLRIYARAMRTYQWSKNVLVFLPLLAAHEFSAQAWGAALLAFLAFSLVASSVYVVNDLLDLRADRAHPRKRNRPIASGAVPLAAASRLAAGLAIGGLAVAALSGSMALVAVVIAYLVLTTAYSVRLKREPIIDICALAALYTIRIGAGAAATDVPLSMWLLAFSMFIFLSLAAMKRQAELIDSASSGRTAAGRGYRVDDLPIIEALAVASACAATLVSALYINTPSVQELYANSEYLWIVSAILLYWLARAAFIAHRGEMDDDPIIFAFRDRVSHLCGAGVGGALMAATFL